MTRYTFPSVSTQLRQTLLRLSLAAFASFIAAQTEPRRTQRHIGTCSRHRSLKQIFRLLLTLLALMSRPSTRSANLANFGAVCWWESLNLGSGGVSRCR